MINIRLYQGVKEIKEERIKVKILRQMKRIIQDLKLTDFYNPKPLISIQKNQNFNRSNTD